MQLLQSVQKIVTELIASSTFFHDGNQQATYYYQESYSGLNQLLRRCIGMLEVLNTIGEKLTSLPFGQGHIGSGSNAFQEASLGLGHILALGNLEHFASHPFKSFIQGYEGRSALFELLEGGACPILDLTQISRFCPHLMTNDEALVRRALDILSSPPASGGSVADQVALTGTSMPSNSVTESKARQAVKILIKNIHLVSFESGTQRLRANFAIKPLIDLVRAKVETVASNMGALANTTAGASPMRSQDGEQERSLEEQKLALYQKVYHGLQDLKDSIQPQDLMLPAIDDRRSRGGKDRI